MSPSSEKKQELSCAIQESIDKKQKSLPYSVSQKLLRQYDLSAPLSMSTNDYDTASRFAQTIIHSGKLVMKISAPDALHKTELKGIFLGIQSEEKFSEAWDLLQNSIKIAGLKNASILLQEQIV